MFKSKWILMSALISFSAFGGVSFEEKKNRVEYLESLASKAVSMNIEAYRRELNYEKEGLTLDKRAENEASLLAEKIKLQIQRAYEVAVENAGIEEAVTEIKVAIEKDLELIAPELREEIRELSFMTLENVQRGEMSSSANLDKLEKSLLKGIQDRSAFLNEEAEDMPMVDMLQDPGPSANKHKDAERKEYSTKAQILESLISERDNIRWVSTSNVTLKSVQLTKVEAKISMQVKAEFLGVSIEAGPTITFKRQYDTNVNVMAEGLNPVLLPDGNFDFYKRNRAGEIIMKAGKPEKRFVNFSCDSDLEFETEYVGSGGFSVAGVGTTTSVSKIFKNTVSLSSRRILVPEYIQGKSVTYKYLNLLCHNDFLAARITNNMTVAGSLNMMMKNVVASLRFSHPKTKCVLDNHCYNWYNKEVIALVKIGNFPRCVEERREKFRACELRGLKGQNCAIFNANGKRVSDGRFEFTCDKGLRCVKTQNEGWFQNFEIYQYAKGKCMPTNPKTYVNPFDHARRNAGYIEVTIK
jgi:hypothetical protein